MPSVTVHLHTILQRHAPEGSESSFVLSMPLQSTVADLLHYLGVELDPDMMIIAVNGRMADLERQLQEGDQVNLMPAISGGRMGCERKRRKGVFP
jgi:sulfur carrier protein ThiS